MMNKLLDLVGMIGNQTVIDSLLKYDKISHEPIFLLAHPKRPDTEEKHQVLANGAWAHLVKHFLRISRRAM
ncbi:MAG: hypothetical protein P8176_09315 [Gammaproteobacteria bacterium]